MSEWRQPWNRLRLGSRRCRLQVLDPQAAFELEPQLVERLGEHLVMVLAAPHEVFGALWGQAMGSPGESLTSALADPVRGPAVAADGLTLLARMLARAVADLDADPSWLVSMTSRLLLGRLEVGGEMLEDWSDVTLSPWDRWRSVAAQLAQTYGPLWSRSPYTLRAKAETFGVPEPKDVPIAVRWADVLAKQGSASSSYEILTQWTPVRMIEIVEASAYSAERERRAYDQARAGDR